MASEQPGNPSKPGAFTRFVASLGAPLNGMLGYIGGLAHLLVETMRWLYRCLILRKVRFGRFALYAQLVRLGVRSIAVICLVCGCIGLILALQMAPTLNEYGQIDKTANVVAISVFRELGPLITAVVLTGFAGASIAAELGTMVVGEEIEALEAHALNPIRFLVLPRVLATVISMVLLAVLGNVVATAAGFAIGTTLLEVPPIIYYNNTIDQLDLADLFTGLFKAGVFGALIGAIACYNGLRVTGGAAGVGRATTYTVVHSIVSIIFTDLIFTAVFYRLGWT